MSIQRSSSPDVSRLIAELAAPDALRRETAVARLAVIGARAVTSLIAMAADEAAAAPARVAALEALEAIGDARAAPVALALLENRDVALAVAAIGVLGPVVRLRDARGSRALEPLAALALAQDVAVERRLAALTALEGLPERLLDPIYQALARDPAPRIVARVTRQRSGAVTPLEELIGGGMPDDPAVLAAVVREDADKTRTADLRILVDKIRTRERRALPEVRGAWMAVRGLVHQSLAARGSRIAVYDLREAIEEADGPLPVGFLAAAAGVGNASCLRPLAAAWTKASAGDRWWRDHLAEAFRAIVRREGLTRRHKTIKQILDKWPEAETMI